jgi:phosphoglycolate phosphatase
MRRIDAIVFDKDGTLFDFHATWSAWSRGLIEDEAGGDPALVTRLCDVLGYDMATGRFRRDSAVIASTTEQIAAMMLPLLPGVGKRDLMARMNDKAALCPQVEAVPLDPFLRALKAKGLWLGLATNDAEEPARAHLTAAGVIGRFDFIAGFDSGYGGKPEPGQLLAFSAAMGIAPAACAMVGDSLHAPHAARAAGMVAIAVLTGIATDAELSPAADVVLESVADLPGWLGH